MSAANTTPANDSFTSPGVLSPNSSFSSPTRLPRSAASFRHGALVEDLKRRVADLESRLLESETARKNLPDIEKINQEMAVTKKNNEILQSNVETMKALCVQLATQLEEANVQLTTYKERHQAAALQLERDVSYEIDALRQDYEKRIDDLRTTLDFTQQKLKQTMDESTERESRLEQRYHTLAHEKDIMLNNMAAQLETLKEQLAQATRQERENRGVKEQGAKLKALRLQQEEAALRGGGPSAMLTDEDIRSERKNVLSFVLSVKRSEFEQTRRIRGLGVPPLQGGSSFHADVASDPIVLVPGGELSSGADDTCHTWMFGTTAGEKVTLSLRIQNQDRDAL